MRVEWFETNVERFEAIVESRQKTYLSVTVGVRGHGIVRGVRGA